MICFSSVPYLCCRSVFCLSLSLSLSLSLPLCMHVHACIHTHIRTCIALSLPACMYTYILHVCVCVCVCARAHTLCLCVCVHIMCIHHCVYGVCVRAQTYMSLHVCLDVCQSVSHDARTCSKNQHTIPKQTLFLSHLSSPARSPPLSLSPPPRLHFTTQEVEKSWIRGLKGHTTKMSDGRSYVDSTPLSWPPLHHYYSSAQVHQQGGVVGVSRFEGGVKGGEGSAGEGKVLRESLFGGEKGGKRFGPMTDNH